MYSVLLALGASCSLTLVIISPAKLNQFNEMAQLYFNKD